jgi:hypothetical protein
MTGLREADCVERGGEPEQGWELPIGQVFVEGKNVELRGTTAKGEKVAWARVFTPEYLQSKFGDLY